MIESASFDDVNLIETHHTNLPYQRAHSILEWLQNHKCEIPLMEGESSIWTKFQLIPLMYTCQGGGVPICLHYEYFDILSAWDICAVTMRSTVNQTVK